MSGIGTFRFVDPDDLSSVLFDANDPTAAAGNPGQLATVTRELRLTAPDLDTVVFDPDAADGGFTAFARAPLVPMAFRLALIGTATHSQLRTGIGALATIVRRGGVIDFLPEGGGSADQLYIDFEPSRVPVLFGEDIEDSFRALGSRQYGEGIPIALLRQPYLRGPLLTAAVNVLGNPTMLADLAGDGRPDGWAWGSTTNITSEAIDSDHEAYAFNIATSANRYLYEWTPNSSAAPGDVWTVSVEARALTAGIARLTPTAQFYQNDGTPIGSLQTGVQVALTPTWQRVTFTTAAAGALTGKVYVGWAFDNAAATSVRVELRRAQAEKAASASPFRVGAQAFSNDPAAAGGRAFPVYVQGTAPAPVRLKVVPTDSAAAVTAARIGVRSSAGIAGRSRLADFLNGTKYGQCESSGNGWTVALGTDTTSTADADASGGNMAQCTYSSSPELIAPRVYLTRTTLLESLGRSVLVVLRAKATAASKHTIQMHWGPSTGAAVYSADPVVLDLTAETGTFGYTDIPLGVITLPDDPAALPGGLGIELWSGRDSGTGNLRFDAVTFVGLDGSAALVTVPGGSDAVYAGQYMTTPGYKLAADPTWTAGSKSGDDWIGDAVLESCGLGTNSGTVYGVGRWRFSFHGFCAPEYGATLVWSCRVVNVTDGTVVASQVGASVMGYYTYDLEIDGVAGKAYQAQVIISSDTGSSRTIYLTWIRVSNVPAVKQNEAIRSAPDRRGGPLVEKLDTSGLPVAVLQADGAVPLVLPPGLSVVTLGLGDKPPGLYPAPEAVLARAATVSADYTPRYDV